MSFGAGLKTIVVSTDLHGQSEAALEYGRKIALAYGARIVLAHGADPLEYAAVDEVPEPVLHELPGAAREILEKLSKDLLSEGIPSHSEIRQGDVAEMLLEVARQYQAGLIVIGSEGRSGAGPIVVGAIAEQLVRRAVCPVLAVAADWNAGPHRPAPGGPVLLAIDRNEAAADAVATAYSLAATFERPLYMVHVRTPAEVTAFVNPCLPRLEEAGLRSSGKVIVHCLIKDGNAVDAVMEAIEQHRPSILVAGVKRARHTGRAHGTAFALLARSHVPVLCVPPAGVTDRRDWQVATPAAI
jgi:nucleotide-binding universal stress UspA family protein